MSNVYQDSIWYSYIKNTNEVSFELPCICLVHSEDQKVVYLLLEMPSTLKAVMHYKQDNNAWMTSLMYEPAKELKIYRVS